MCIQTFLAFLDTNFHLNEIGSVMHAEAEPPQTHSVWHVVSAQQFRVPPCNASSAFRAKLIIRGIKNYRQKDLHTG